MLAPSLNPRLWYSPQSAGALARNLASNFYYTVYAHFGLIWPDTLPHDVLSTLTTNDEYPEPTAIPDNEFIRQKIVPAIKFLLPILRELWTEKERQAGTLVDIEPTGDPVEQQGLHLFIARKLRNAQDELKVIWIVVLYWMYFGSPRDYSFRILRLRVSKKLYINTQPLFLK